MFGKQLNFLKIFDEAKPKNEPSVEKVEEKIEESQIEENQVEESQIEENQVEENVAEGKIEDKVEDKVEAQPEKTSEELKLETQSEPKLESEPELKTQPESEVEKKPRRGVFIKLIPGIKLPESELAVLRAKLLAKGNDQLTPDDFTPFAEEINKYDERYKEFDVIFRRLEPGEEKRRQYSKKVFPELFDEKEYLATAELYMKYRKVCDDKIKLDEEMAAAEKIRAKKAKKGKVYKNFDKSQTEQDKQSPENKQFSRKKINEDEYFDLDDGKPDPYGDIYPYSRIFNKRYKKEK